MTCCILSLLARFVSWCVFLDREVEAIHRNKKKKERERRKAIGGSTRKHALSQNTQNSTKHHPPSPVRSITNQSTKQDTIKRYHLFFCSRINSTVKAKLPINQRRKKKSYRIINPKEPFIKIAAENTYSQNDKHISNFTLSKPSA